METAFFSFFTIGRVLTNAVIQHDPLFCWFLFLLWQNVVQILSEGKGQFSVRSWNRQENDSNLTMKLAPILSKLGCLWPSLKEHIKTSSLFNLTLNINYFNIYVGTIHAHPL